MRSSMAMFEGASVCVCVWKVSGFVGKSSVSMENQRLDQKSGGFFENHTFCEKNIDQISK